MQDPGKLGKVCVCLQEAGPPVTRSSRCELLFSGSVCSLGVLTPTPPSLYTDWSDRMCKRPEVVRGTGWVPGTEGGIQGRLQTKWSTDLN